MSRCGKSVIGWVMSVAVISLIGARRVGREVGEAAGLGAQVVVEEVADPVGIVGQHLAHVVGVDERLVLGRRRALVDQVVAGEPVGDADEHDAGEQGDEREEQRDAGAQTEGIDASPRATVWQETGAPQVAGRAACELGIGSDRDRQDGSHAAGEAPGGGRYLTGAA